MSDQMYKTWRDYPESYHTLFKRFKEEGNFTVHFSQKADAQRARRELYQFRTAIKKGCTAMEDNEATELHETVDRMTIKIEPHNGSLTEPATMTLTDNPILEAIDKALEGKS